MKIWDSVYEWMDRMYEWVEKAALGIDYCNHKLILAPLYRFTCPFSNLADTRLVMFRPGALVLLWVQRILHDRWGMPARWDLWARFNMHFWQKKTSHSVRSNCCSKKLLSPLLKCKTIKSGTSKPVWMKSTSKLLYWSELQASIKIFVNSEKTFFDLFIGLDFFNISITKSERTFFWTECTH